MPNQYTATKLLELSKENWPESVSAAHEFAIYINRIRDIDSTKVRKQLRQDNLSVTEFDVLAALRRSPLPHCLSPGELQEATLLSSGGLTKILYNLGDKELIERSVQLKDNRSKLVHLTEKGKQLIELSMDTLNTMDTISLKKALGTKKLKELNCLLRELLEILESDTGT